MKALLFSQLVALADLKQINSDFAQAIAALNKRLQLEPQLLDTLHHMELCQIFVTLDEFDTAFQLQKAVNFTATQIYLRKAIINVAEADEIEAIGNLRKALKNNKTGEILLDW